MGLGDWIAEGVSAVTREVTGSSTVPVQVGAQTVAVDTGATFRNSSLGNAAQTAGEHPGAILSVGAGVVLVATGVGAAAGAGLIARGGVELGTAELSDAQKDSTQVATPQAAKLQQVRSLTAQGQAAAARGEALKAEQDRARAAAAAAAAAVPQVRPTLLQEFFLALDELFGGRR